MYKWYSFNIFVTKFLFSYSLQHILAKNSSTYDFLTNIIPRLHDQADMEQKI